MSTEWDNRPGAVNYTDDPARVVQGKNDARKGFNIDWQRIGMLLHIVNLSSQHPKLVHVTNAALAELDFHAFDAKKASDLAKKEAADREAEGARKHVEEVRKAEEERLAREEEAIKKRPPGKTPAELDAEANAGRATDAAARANANVEGENRALQEQRLREGEAARTVKVPTPADEPVQRTFPIQPVESTFPRRNLSGDTTNE